MYLLNTYTYNFRVTSWGKPAKSGELGEISPSPFQLPYNAMWFRDSETVL